MLKRILSAALFLASAPAAAQDKATLDTRQLLAETVTTAKPRAEYLTGARDAQPAFKRVLTKYREITAPIVKDPATSTPPVAPKRPMGMNVAPAPWYSTRQTFTNLLQGGYWAINWAQVPSDKLTDLGYPKDWSQSYVRLLGVPTGGVWKDSNIACTWAGSGTLTFSGGTNQVKGDHALAFTVASWNGLSTNRWFSLYDVKATDPFRDFECHDTNPANASGNEFSKEIVASLSKYTVLRFMDWNGANNGAGRTMANKPNPKSLDNPTAAVENQIRLANLTGTDLWFNHQWNDDPAYIAWAAKTAHDSLPAGRHIYVEYSNEVWNWQFKQAQDNLVEATALKINANNGYGAWQNIGRRGMEAFKIWEKAFADRPKDLVRVLGTQVSYPEVTRQMLKYPGVLDHIDAIAGAAYFNQDTKQTYSFALQRAGIAQAANWQKTTCETAREAKPSMRCLMYEGGQHNLPSDLFPLAQYQQVQRSQEMGDLYSEYLPAMVTIGKAEFPMQYNDVGTISKYGAWGLQEYGGQTDAPKQMAVDAYLKR